MEKVVKNEEKLKEKARKISILEGSSYSIMDGFGLRYITPFALDIGAKNFHIGLLSSIPSLLGNLSQLLTVKAMKFWTRKRIVFTGVLLQSLMWLALIAIGVMYFVLNIRGQSPAYLLILFYTLLILFGSFSGPAWNSWMRDIVPQNRGEYFGKRNKIAGTISLICMVLAGFIIDYYEQSYLFVGYLILFSISFFGRLGSAILFLKQYEPSFKPEERYYFTFFQFVRKSYQNNFGRFTLFFSLISFSVAIASPFFSVYMLKDLGFSKLFYIITVFSSSAFSLLSMPLWGKVIDRYGSMKVMRYTGFFVIWIPLFWVASVYLGSMIIQFSYIFILEAISGFLWAGFNLAAGNFIYDAVTRERMALCTSYFTVINGFGALIGALIGGFVSSINFTYFGLSALLLTFILSSVFRLITYFFMMPLLKEVRPVKDGEVRDYLRSTLKKKVKSAWNKFNELEIFSLKVFDNFRLPRFGDDDQ